MTSFRIGSGFDAHKIERGKGFTLAGVFISCSHKIIAHSDGDIISHSVCDALLGAANLGDIGQHFPNTQDFKNVSGETMIRSVLKKIKEKNYKISNLDITYIGEIPNISNSKNKIVKNLSKYLKVNEELISLKATTTDKLGFIGKKEGVACLANVLIHKA